MSNCNPSTASNLIYPSFAARLLDTFIFPAPSVDKSMLFPALIDDVSKSLPTLFNTTDSVAVAVKLPLVVKLIALFWAPILPLREYKDKSPDASIDLPVIFCEIPFAESNVTSTPLTTPFKTISPEFVVLRTASPALLTDSKFKILSGLAK